MKKLAVLGAALVGCLLLTPSASAQPIESAVSDFGGCLAAQREGDLLLMIDESGSLQQSDPGASPRDVDTNSYAAEASIVDRCSNSIGQI